MHGIGQKGDTYSWKMTTKCTFVIRILATSAGVGIKVLAGSGNPTQRAGQEFVGIGCRCGGEGGARWNQTETVGVGGILRVQVIFVR